MMTKNYCKKCFRAVVDPTASDKHLLMSGHKLKCPSCGQIEELVGAYFKYGEHTVTADGHHFVGEARHVGVNPNYSFFNNSYPYADVENYKG